MLARKPLVLTKAPLVIRNALDIVMHKGCPDPVLILNFKFNLNFDLDFSIYIYIRVCIYLFGDGGSALDT